MATWEDPVYYWTLFTLSCFSLFFSFIISYHSTSNFTQLWLCSTFWPWLRISFLKMNILYDLNIFKMKKVTNQILFVSNQNVLKIGGLQIALYFYLKDWYSQSPDVACFFFSSLSFVQVATGTNSSNSVPLYTLHHPVQNKVSKF